MYSHTPIDILTRYIDHVIKVIAEREIIMYSTAINAAVLGRINILYPINNAYKKKKLSLELIW